jgi:hypothetical protein
VPLATRYEIEFLGCHTASPERSSGGSSSGSSSPGGYRDLLAQIELFDDGGNPIGAIQFYREGASIPKDFTDEGYVTAHLPYSMFGDVYDALRNEKPVNLKYVSRPASEGGILAVGRQEPIGEND